MKINNKKAAMFGLDARIALAIFGALSVISGAALYSAIQQAKVVQYVTAMAELGKAIEQFMLDTGTNLTLSNTNFMYADLLDNTNNLAGWNGPYINITGDLGGAGTREYLNNTPYGQVLIRHLQASLGGANYTGCTTSPCYNWLQISGIDASFAKAIDVYVDGSDSPTTGNVRRLTAHPGNVFIKGPIKL